MPDPMDVIDRQVFTELQDAVGADFVAELVGTFFEEAPTLLAGMREAVSDGSDVDFRRAAHSLKTNAQTFGAKVLSEQARTLELGGLPVDPVALDTVDAAYAAAAAALEAIRHG